MKLYKGEKVMQLVDKDQVQDCLDAGWSRTEPVEEVEEIEEELDDSDDVAPASSPAPVTRKIKPPKKKR